MKSLVDKFKNKKEGNSANLENSSNQQEKFKSSTEFYDTLVRNLRSKMTKAQLKANNIATSDDASIWLSSLPLKHETKREFFDAVLLSYGCELKRLPQKYVCKSKIKHRSCINIQNWRICYTSS